MLYRYVNWSIEMKNQHFSCTKLLYQLNSEKGNRLQFIEVEKHQAMAMSVVIQFINCGMRYVGMYNVHTLHRSLILYLSKAKDS